MCPCGKCLGGTCRGGGGVPVTYMIHWQIYNLRFRTYIQFEVSIIYCPKICVSVWVFALVKYST